jgi:branched-subunit amino acid ABC-type transport system permease component
MGFYLLYRTHKFLNLGHGAIIAIGAYSTYFFSEKVFGFSVGGLVCALIVGVLVAGVVGILADLWVYKTLRDKKRSSIMMLVASLGVSFIIQSAIAIGFTSQYHVVDTGEHFAALFHVGGAAVTLVQIVSLVVAVVVIAVLFFVLRKTTFGRSVRAVSDDTEVSVIVGIPVPRILLSVSFLSAALAGLAGGFIGIDTGILPLMGFAVFLKAAVSDIIGGLETFWGPILGALLVAVLENVVVLLLGTEWRDVAVYVMLLIFLLWKPGGLIRAK